MEGRGRVDKSSAVLTHNSDEDDGVVFGSDDSGSTRVAPILLFLAPHSFPLLPLSSLAQVCGGWPQGGGGAMGQALGHPGPRLL